MPENESPPHAAAPTHHSPSRAASPLRSGSLPPERLAALGLPPPVVGASLRERLAAVADALGTSVSRLLVGCLVGALVLGALAWTVAAPVDANGNAGSAADEALPRAAPPDSAASAAAVRIVVAAAGAVVRPGVYRVASDSRVADVIDAAGGTAPDADLDQVNLAAPVADGERVYVPRRGEQPPGGLAAGPPGAPAQPVNLNSATVEQLDALPGIGPSTARAIVAWRQEHGRFKRVDDLLNVRGIGPAKLDALRGQVRV